MNFVYFQRSFRMVAKTTAARRHMNVRNKLMNSVIGAILLRYLNI